MKKRFMARIFNIEFVLFFGFCTVLAVAECGRMPWAWAAWEKVFLIIDLLVYGVPVFALLFGLSCLSLLAPCTNQSVDLENPSRTWYLSIGFVAFMLLCFVLGGSDVSFAP